jgi:DNA transposition AAA+ family ATPase
MSQLNKANVRKKALVDEELKRSRLKRSKYFKAIQDGKEWDCMSDGFNEELYKKFFDLVGSPDEGKRYSQSKAALLMDYSPGVVSAYKNRSYTGNIKLLEEKVSEFLKRDTRRLELVTIPTAHTSVTEKVIRAVTIAQDEATIAVIIGDSGCGKTTALRQYMRESHSALMVDVDPSFSQSRLLEEISRVAGIDTSGNKSFIIDRIITTLRGRDAVLIVDEADYLSDSSLELLRRIIHDKALTGLVLAGLPRLEYKIKNLRNDHQQLQSRVGVMIKLGNLNKHDAEKILCGVWKDLPKETIDVFIKTSNGSTRTLVKLMERVHQLMEINKAEKPNADIIARAGELLMR